MRDGKQPLDRGRAPTPGRAAAFVDIQRRTGDPVGAKVLAMARRPRDERPAQRVGKFLDIARRGDGA